MKTLNYLSAIPRATHRFAAGKRCLFCWREKTVKKNRKRLMVEISFILDNLFFRIEENNGEKYK